MVRRVAGYAGGVSRFTNVNVTPGTPIFCSKVPSSNWRVTCFVAGVGTRVPFHVPEPLPLVRTHEPVKLLPSADRVNVNVPLPVLSDHVPLRTLPVTVPAIVPE